MPKRRQPNSLRDIAMESLAKSIATCCVRLVDRVNTSNLHQGLQVIKLEIHRCIPALVFHRFTVRVLQRISNLLGDRLKWISENNIDSLLEIFMERLRKLECFHGVSGSLLFGLYRNLAKLNGLEIIDILTSPYFSGPASDTRSCTTALIRMKNLTTLTYRVNCTDEVLEAVGQSCFQLKSLDVSFSKVTDLGMCSMGRCSQLQTVEFRDTQVTSEGFVQLLSTHPNITSLGHFDNLHYDCSHRVIGNIPVENRSLTYFDLCGSDLMLLIEKCPRVKSVTITGFCTHQFEISELRTINQLRELQQLTCECETFIRVFIPFLPFNGSRITSLDLGWREERGFSLDKSKLKLVRLGCQNLEYFKFSYMDHVDRIRVLLPSFRRLKTMEISFAERSSHRMKLDLCRMKSLKVIYCVGFYTSITRIVSIMNDPNSFPKLSKIITDDDSCRAEVIAAIARSRNINFTFEIRC